MFIPDQVRFICINFLIRNNFYHGSQDFKREPAIQEENQSPQISHDREYTIIPFSILADGDNEIRHTTSRKKSTLDKSSTIKFTRAGTKALTMGIRLPSQDKVDIKRAHHPLQHTPSLSDQNDSLNNLQEHMNEEDEFEFAILEQV
jgi:hypothetical protein